MMVLRLFPKRRGGGPDQGSRRLAGRPGNVLALLLAIMAVISATWMAALEPLRQEIRRVGQDYHHLEARAAAESGIELALWEMLNRSESKPVAGRPGEKLVFEYGAQYFPEIDGRSSYCRVLVWLHDDRIFLEATGQIVKRMGDKAGSAVLAERKLKRLVALEGVPPGPRIEWQVGD
ncbi:MAG: hypothetical protein AB1641_26240 [Thermodesulfobacteriota bacterium]